MWFHLQAASRLVTRRKGPVLRMAIVALVASTWCIAGAVWAIGTWRDADERASAMAIDVVCSNDSTGVRTRTMSQTIARMPGVVEATVRSSDAVWNEFAADMHISDTDLRAIAELPAMIRVRLAPQYVTQEFIDRFAHDLRSASRRSIASITWPRTYVAMVEDHRRTLIVFGGAAGILSLVLFIVAITYAFNAEVHRAGADLRVAELLGAPMRWIAAPHTIVGLLAGACGLVASTLVVLALQSSARHLAPWVGRATQSEILLAAAALAVVGIANSWTQSLLAVREAMRRR